VTRSLARVIALVAVVAVASSAGCKKTEDDASTRAGAAPSSKPVDHLAPGELVEGKETAFGVALPRAIDRTKTLSPSFYGRVHAPPNAVLAYFQARLTGGKLIKEPGGTLVIDQAHAADPKVVLMLRVDREDGASRIELRDVTPPAPELHATDEERWSAAGLKPNGAVDPTKLH
jgi:hypothetical protein